MKFLFLIFVNAYLNDNSIKIDIVFAIVVEFHQQTASNMEKKIWLFYARGMIYNSVELKY